MNKLEFVQDMMEKISDHIDKILKDVLETDKKIELEQTINTYNFLGNNKKPF